MSVVIAYKRNDVIYLAADSQATCGNEASSICKDNYQKIHQFDFGVTIAMTGSANLLAYFVSNPSWFKLQKDMHYSKEFLLNCLIPFLFDKAKEGGYASDPEEKKAISLKTGIILVSENKMFRCDSCYIDEVDHYCSVGCGENIANPLLKELDNVEEKDIEKEMYKIVETCAKYNVYVGLPVVMWNSRDNVLERKCF